MAVVFGTVCGVSVVQADAVSPVQIALVLCTLAGTYAQADNAQVTNVAQAIADSRRNGKTITPRGAMLAQTSSKAADPSTFLAAKNVAVSGNNVTFEITDNSYVTELADGAVPAQYGALGLMVAFTES